MGNVSIFQKESTMQGSFSFFAILLASLYIFLLFACSSDSSNSGGEGEVISSSSDEGDGISSSSVIQIFTDDRDGHVYGYVTIGDQIWMAENLNYNATGSKCYNDSIANCEKYGRLYDWEISLNACPTGWHLPSDAEWTALTDYAGGGSTAGKKLKAANGWSKYGNGANGSNDYDFSALPGGGGFDDNFNNVRSYGYWWSSTEYGDRAYFRSMFSEDGAVYRSYYDKRAFHSVRCIKN